MFCYQRNFGLPTEIVTPEMFRALITAPETIKKVREAREALARGDKKMYNQIKNSLPIAVFIATFNESEKEFENKRTGEKTKKKGAWRLQKESNLNGLCVIDFDHVEGDVRKVWEEAFAKLSDEDKARVLYVFVTPSGHGLKVVFIADPNEGNLIDNQIVFSLKLGLNPDESGKDASRGAFLTTQDDIILIDEDRLYSYENEEFAKKYGEDYRNGRSGATITDSEKLKVKSEKLGNPNENENSHFTSHISHFTSQLEYKGVSFQKIIDAWSKQRFSEDGASRHDASVRRMWNAP